MYFSLISLIYKSILTYKRLDKTPSWNFVIEQSKCVSEKSHLEKIYKLMDT